MRIEVLGGKAVISKKSILSDIESRMEFLIHSDSLNDADRETLACMYFDIEILSDILSFEDTGDVGNYPFGVNYNHSCQ